METGEYGGSGRYRWGRGEGPRGGPMRADGLRHRRKAPGTEGRGNTRMLPLADGAVEGDTGHVLLERLIKLSTLVILQRSREDGGEQESMGRVHELNALKCNHMWTAMSEWRVTATGARGSASSLRARPSARLPVSCGGARRQAFCAVSIADMSLEKAS